MNRIFKIVTFNIRCVWKGDGDGINSFVHRAGMVYEKIMQEKPDLIMFQEIRSEHLELLKRMLPEYTFVGHFREVDYTGEGLYTAILNEKIQLLGFESYWLSPTPYVAGSRYENQSEYPRTCLTLKLRDIITGNIFRSVNIHLDHISDEARIEGIRQVLRITGERNRIDDIPTIIAGDFNAHPDSETMKFCKNYDKFKIYEITGEIDTTFHDWGKTSEKIDYIFITESIKNNVKAAYVWDDCDEDIYLSDHYPLCAEIDIKNI